MKRLVPNRSKKARVFSGSGGPVSLIIIAVLVDLASAITMRLLQIPLYFNTWVTSLAVIHSGFPAGAIASILYSLIMAIMDRMPVTLLWSVSGILIAAMTWFFWKKGWINLRYPVRILAAGLMSGMVSAILLIAMATAFSLPTLYRYAGGVPVPHGSYREPAPWQSDRTVRCRTCGQNSLALSRCSCRISRLWDYRIGREKTKNLKIYLV